MKITSRSASAIILDDENRLLLLMRDDLPLWVNVGGSCDDQENFEIAMRREVLEEACTEVDIISIIGDFYSSKGNNTYQQERVYLCKPKYGQKPSIGNEGAFIEWFDHDKIPQNISPKYRMRLQYALENKINKQTVSITLPDDLPDMLDFIRNTNDISDFYRLDDWNNNHRVISKRAAGLLQFDPLNHQHFTQATGINLIK
jgi:8-oxo-dGTP pyrophosphatase MutT (NUDIX family)